MVYKLFILVLLPISGLSQSKNTVGEAYILFANRAIVHVDIVEVEGSFKLFYYDMSGTRSSNTIYTFSSNSQQEEFQRAFDKTGLKVRKVYVLNPNLFRKKILYKNEYRKSSISLNL